MKLYTNNIWRWTINLLYPAIIFVFQSWGPILDSWTGPILFVALFCFLWSDVKDLFLSTGLTRLIVLMYIVFVLIPQMLILATRLRVTHYYKK